MKLTKTQINELLNQHTGTGYMIVKLNDKTIRISDIGISKNGNWYIGLDGKPLQQGLVSLANELLEVE